MRSAVIILTVVVAVVAEAPYHLPRPAPHFPSFNYPSAPAPPLPGPPSLPPAPFPQLPQPRPAPQPFAPLPHPVPALQPSYIPSQGYNYQKPSFGPAFVHPAPQPVPQPIPAYHPPPPVHFPAPQPQPLPITYPRPIPPPYSPPQPISIPQSSYGLPQPQPQPQFQPQPLPPTQPLSNFYILPQAQGAPASTFHQAQNYAYQQPISHLQHATALPLQSQPLTNSAVSSYQADSNQYATTQAQIHGEALDQTVVNMVQNIIRDNEHSVAKNAGYLSLISGVSLESAKPSVEISSFVQNSPQSDVGLIDVRSASSAAQSSAGTSSSYNAPTVSTSTSHSSENSANVAFVSDNKPGISYGVPN